MSREVLYFHFNVINMERALRFYTDVLGATILEHAFPAWARLQLGHVEIGLLITDTKAPYIQRGDLGSRGGATMTIRSDDVLADRKMLEAAGVSIIREAKEFWGHYLVFEDSEGNVHRLVKRFPWQDNPEFADRKPLAGPSSRE